MTVQMRRAAGGCFWGLAAACVLALASPRDAAGDAVNIIQHHNNPSRDGLYIDPTFTKTAAANLKRDLSFNGAIAGNLYAQPLYLDSGPNSNAAVIVVTESNNVYALDALSGTIIWQTNVGPSVPLSLLPCGDINPVGIVGTPVVDLPSRSLFFDALINAGGSPKHMIYSLNLDTGAVNTGWPVDVDANASFNGTPFTSLTQGQRSALAVIGGILYVPYGGNAGDCSIYHGWLVGVPLDNPSNVVAWATSTNGGGSWAPGGVSSDGTNLFLGTGNTFNASAWSGGEAIVRFQPGPIFSQQTTDYWVPSNWQTLDSGDLDIGSSGALLVDVPGATPSSLIVACGKDGNAYLLNRTNLGGISAPLAKTTVTTTFQPIQAPATYRTTQDTYVAMCVNTQITAMRIAATNPPTIHSAWTQSTGGRCSPFVTSTDGTNDMIVWGLGCEGDQRLHGFDGDTGATVFSGGGPNELMANTRRFNTAVEAHGRIYVGTSNKVYAFTLPASPIVLTNPVALPENVFQFGFMNVAGLSFTAFCTTNISSAFTNWTQLGSAQEISPGQYQVAYPLPETDCPWFFRVQSP